MAAIKNDLVETIHDMQAYLARSAESNAERMLVAVEELLTWLHYFEVTSDGGDAKELLAGAKASIVEAVAYIGLGLGRASIAAIRCQIDLLLSYTYFRDHPAEWELVKRTGDGFKLRSSIHRYHEDTTPGFKKRISAIDAKSRYSLQGVYQILSAHIHGQTTFTIPTANILKHVRAPDTFLASIVDAQVATTEAMSNCLMAIYAHDWPELPAGIVTRAKILLGSKAVEFFRD